MADRVRESAEGTRWTTIAPIHGCSGLVGLVTESIELALGVTVAPIPGEPWFEEAAKGLSEWHQQLLSECKLCFAVSYRAVSLGAPDPDWSLEGSRSIQNAKEEHVRLANLSFWLTRPAPLGFETIFHFEFVRDDVLCRQRRAWHTRVTVAEHEKSERFNQNDVEIARRFHGAILDLPRLAPLFTGLRMIWGAINLIDWETRYLMLWVAVEALFGADDGREITHRLAQRASLFLESSRNERKELFRSLKDAYRWRSKLVHGGKLHKLKPEKSSEIMHLTEDVLRRSYRRILVDHNLQEVFDSKKQREEFLDDLCF